MAHVTVLILHPERPAPNGTLVGDLVAVRRSLAEAHRVSFERVGADEARVVSEAPDDTPFGARLRRLARGLPGGLVVLGSGAIPLATRSDLAAFVRVAASGDVSALANDRYSADAIAIGRASILEDVPDLDGDNALPRWLYERAGVPVQGLERRWRLGVDLDSPIDLLLVARYREAPRVLHAAAAGPSRIGERAGAAIERVRATLADRRAEVLVAGRTGTRSLRWLERETAARIRALVEERGLHASSPLALATDERMEGRPRPARPPASVLGMLLERDGPEALGEIVERLADAAVVDTRVLLAHRLGRDASRWPSDEDRYASDLLRPDLVADPWLRALTGSAAGARVPVLLGGHTLVGPGVRLLAAEPAVPAR